MPRRGENIYKRKDGRWEGRYIREYNEAGKAKYGSVYGKTYAEAKKKLAAQKEQQRLAALQGCNMTINELLAKWLDTKVSRVKASSFARYQILIRTHLSPELGPLPVHKLTVQILEDFLAKKRKSGRLDGTGGLSAKSVNDIAIILKSALKLARRRFGFVDRNNASDFSVPDAPKHRVRVFSDCEISRIKCLAADDQDANSFGYLLCLNTGLRIGELCGLKWSDFDRKENTIHIERTVQRINHDGKTEVVIQTPKSECSDRIIPLHPVMMQALLNLKANTPSGAYFLSGTEKPVDPRTMQYRFCSFLKRAGVEARNFHTLRHSFATRCIENGMDAKCLCELLGHSNVKTTLQLYVHPSMKQKREYLNAISELPRPA